MLIKVKFAGSLECPLYTCLTAYPNSVQYNKLVNNKDFFLLLSLIRKNFHITCYLTHDKIIYEPVYNYYLQQDSNK